MPTNDTTPQQNPPEAKGFKAFLRRKDIVFSFDRYLVKAMGNMAQGLFASLLIGTILATIGGYVPGMGWLVEVADFAKSAAGPAMAVAIAFSLNAPPLVLFSCAAVGMAGNALGGPVGTFLATIVAAELGKMVSRETKVDILVTPAVTIVSGVLVAKLAGPPVSAAMQGLGNLVMMATELQPFWMGILVSAIVGLVLTLPISSAALCIMLELGGLAAGAATAGCCAHMVGFAILSFRENRWGGLFSQGLGTSMLQMPNLVKRPRLFVPAILISMVTGPIATVVFRLENIPVGAGMGTSGLVGPIGMVAAMPDGGARLWVGMLLVCFILPGVLAWLFGIFFRRIGWIREGDLKLDLN